MYFHLIWIKEKNWKKYDLDILLQWWDEDFLRKFLWYRWVVIVSISEFKEDPRTFWNIILLATFSDINIQIITKWEDLWERLYFIMFLWLSPINANYIENPIAQDQVKQLIETNSAKINEENEKIKNEQEALELKEQKKYEETWITEWLKIINSTIDHIQQLTKAWQWIISWNELKTLDNYLNEMKKIRLWTNFNKMAMLILDANHLAKKVEKDIFEANKDKTFLINENSSISNIDLLSEYFRINRILDESTLWVAWLSPGESMLKMMWNNSIFFVSLAQDVNYIFKTTTIDETFAIVMNLIEYIVLCAIVVICLIWLFAPLFWVDSFSLYLLPAMWWLWLLLYLFNNLKLKWIAANGVWFAILAAVYRIWLKLLLNTFAL